jgi:lupus La protein
MYVIFILFYLFHADVLIDTIASFKRMQQITMDRNVIVTALKSSDMLQVDADEKLVRRITPLPEENTADKRTLYVKGFPATSTLEEIEAFLEKFGDIKAIRMRRYKTTKDFKGSIFVEFGVEEQAQKFLAEQQNLKYKTEDEKPLIIQSKESFNEEKEKERENYKEKKKTDEMQSRVTTALQELKYDEGTLIHVANIGEGVGFKDLKTIFKEFEVAFVEHPWNGSLTEAVIRFNNPANAKKAVDDVKEKQTKIGGNDPVLTVLEGQEERSAYEKLVENKVRDESTQKQRGGKKGGGKKGYKGGKGGKKGGKRKTEGDGERPNKKAKTEK